MSPSFLGTVMGKLCFLEGDRLRDAPLASSGEGVSGRLIGIPSHPRAQGPPSRALKDPGDGGS